MNRHLFFDQNNQKGILSAFEVPSNCGEKGTLKNPNIQRRTQIARRAPSKWQLAGIGASLEDLCRVLRRLPFLGIPQPQRAELVACCVATQSSLWRRRVGLRLCPLLTLMRVEAFRESMWTEGQIIRINIILLSPLACMASREYEFTTSALPTT